jgi:N-acetylmuramoyl-L-alanine amidase
MIKQIWFGIVVIILMQSCVRDKLIQFPESMPYVYDVLIDAGHGGDDPGAQSQSVLEKDLMLSLSQKLKKALEHEGYSVYCTRSNDESIKLNERIAKMDSIEARLLISLHTNFSKDGNDNGINLYIRNQQQSGPAAEAIQKELTQASLMHFNKIEETSHFKILNTPFPSVMLNLGYLSNESDLIILRNEEQQTVLAQNISKAVKSYFRLHNQ